MLNYETLDTIADSYNPFLAISTLVFIGMALAKSQRRLAWLRSTALFLVLLIAYGLMFIDRQFQIWAGAGLDYSTHTAVALVLIACLSSNAPKQAAFWVGSFVGYLLLMLYQGYHTVSDILTTGMVVGAMTWPTLAYFYKHHPLHAPAGAEL